MLDSLKPDGTAIRAIRTPPDVVEPVPGSSRRPPPRRGTAVRALTALREAQNHRNAALAGQQENRRGWRGVRKPLSDFTITRRLLPNGRCGRPVTPNQSGNIFQIGDRVIGRSPPRHRSPVSAAAG